MPQMRSTCHNQITDHNDFRIEETATKLFIMNAASAQYHNNRNMNKAAKHKGWIESGFEGFSRAPINSKFHFSWEVFENLISLG